MAIKRRVSVKVTQHVQNFGAYTSMPGIAQIVESRKTSKRVAWIIVLVLAWIFFAIEMSFVLHRYYSYHKTLITDIVPSGVPFPDITLCNLGSFDYYSVYKMSKGVEELLGFKKGQDKPSNTFLLKEGQTMNEEGQVVNEDGSVVDVSEDAGNADGSAAADESAAADDDPVKEYLKDTFVKGMSKFYQIVNSTGLRDTERPSLEKMYSRTTVASNVPQSLLSANGYQQDDLIIKCTYGNKPCKFKKIFDPYFFNCYTFDSANVTSSVNDTSPSLVEGVENGLTVMLLAGTGMLDKGVEGFGLMPGIYAKESALSGTSGVRVVVHPPGTRPFPITEGYDVPPGQMASFGIIPRKRERLDKPYGKCSDEYPFLNEEEQKLAGPYRKTACEKVCVQDHIYEECSCYKNTLLSKMDLLSADHNEGDRCFEEKTLMEGDESCQQIEKCSGTQEFRKCFNFYSKEDPKCDDSVLLKLFEKMKCAERATEQALANKTILHQCECDQACDEFLYDLSYSLSKWPSTGIEAQSIFQETMVDLGYLEKLSPKEKKDLLSDFFDEDLKTALREFSKISVYVKDANIFLTQEVPAMSLTQLISEIGGQIGVWIGISVITIAELLEFIIEMCLEFCWRKPEEEKSPEDLEHNFPPQFDEKQSFVADNNLKPLDNTKPFVSFNVSE